MKKIASFAALAGAALMLSACDVEQTDEGSVPDVDVSAEGGDLPAYDVDAPDVDVETGTTTVEVPTVDVDVNETDAEEEPAAE